MSQKRILTVGLVVVVFGCLIVGGLAIYRSGQSQGYVMGRLSAGGDDGAVAPYGFGYPSRRSSFAPFLCSAGLFVLLLVAIGKFFHFRAWKAAGGPKGEYWARRWHHGPMGPWCWGWKEPTEGKAEPDAETSEAEAES